MNGKFKKYMVLIVFITISIIGLLIRYMAGEHSWLWNLWGSVDVAFAVSLGILAFMAYRQMIKSEDEISIYFNVDEKLKKTGLSLLRKDCTRGEILGVLGMMQRTTKERFSFDPKELAPLLEEVREVQKGNKDKFVICVSRTEYEQFNLDEGK